MKITVATQEQLSIVKQLAQDIWYVAYKDIISTDQIDYMLNMIYSIASLEKQYQNNHVFLLVQDTDSFIGYASYELNFELTHKTKIHKLYVLPHWQGKGVGKLLLDEITHTAKRSNQESLILNVNKYNTAVHFYQKVGFSIAHSTLVDIGNSYVMDDYVMELKIQ
jgi:ribosomal protein S18 acetylase RimI-like enzyme